MFCAEGDNAQDAVKLAYNLNLWMDLIDFKVQKCTKIHMYRYSLKAHSASIFGALFFFFDWFSSVYPCKNQQIVLVPPKHY